MYFSLEKNFHQALEGIKGFPDGSVGKETACNARNAGSTSGSGRSPAGGNGNPLQYSCPENPTDRGAWQTTVHGVAESQTRLKQTGTHAHFPVRILT